MIYYNYLITTGDSSINRKANRKEKDEVIEIINEFNSNPDKDNLSIYVTNMGTKQLSLSISSSLDSESDIEKEIISLLQALGIDSECSIEKEEVCVKTLPSPLQKEQDEDISPIQMISAGRIVSATKDT